MTSAAVLFYGRRSRTSRTFDDLGFGSLAPSPFSPSSSTSSDSSNSNNQCHRRHHHHDHRRGDLHRRHRHINFDRPDKFRHSSNVLQPSPRPPLPVISPLLSPISVNFFFVIFTKFFICVIWLLDDSVLRGIPWILYSICIAGYNLIRVVGLHTRFAASLFLLSTN